MPFPAVTYTTNRGAASGMVNNAQEAGLSVNALNEIAQIQSVVANLLKNDPSTVSVPAADVSSGTFGANIPDTGVYNFPSSVGYVTRVTSTTALATPAALVATTATSFASTVSGAVIMGFGTTNDVTLMNQAGTAVLGVTANTLNVTVAGSLAYVNMLSSTTAQATPSAYAATTATVFASAIGGLCVMGFGSGNDLSFKNRNGTDVFSIPANTTILQCTTLQFVTSLKSTAAFATPSALAATQFSGFASTVSGAVLMGFGTTTDVALMNRAGTVVLGVLANATDIALTGKLTWTAASQIVGTTDGILTFLNTATTSFSRTTYGGTTASFPALRRTNAQLDCVLADASGYTQFNVSALGFQQLTTINHVSDGVVMGKDSGGTTFRFNWAGSTTSFPAVARTGITLACVLGDGTGAANLAIGGNGALATSATAGFLFVSSCAGTPTGVPASIPSGTIATIYDTTANKIWFYNGSWRGALVV